MTTIKLTIWFMIKNLINSIKRAWKVWAVVFGIMIFAFAMAGVSSLISKDDNKSTSEEYADESYEDSKDDITIKNGTLNISFTVEDGEAVLYYNNERHEIGILLYQIVSALIIQIVLIYSIIKGLKNGIAIFEMADVNILFPSPMKPQAILLFKMLMQIGSAAIGIFYLLWQLPNLIQNFNLKISDALMIILAFSILLVIGKLVSVFVYLVSASYQRTRNIFKVLCVMIGLLPIIFLVLLKSVFNYGMVEAFQAVFLSNVSNAIPVWGWLKGSVGFAVAQNYMAVLMCFACTILFMGIFVWVTWNIKADFYEDAITGAVVKDTKEKAALAAAEGKVASGVKHNSKSSVKRWEKLRNKKLAFGKYEGSKVFFAKTILNRKRFNRCYGLLSSKAQFDVVVVFGIGIFMKYVLDEASMLPIAITLLVLMYFNSFSNPIQEDLSHSYIYMIPESPRATMTWAFIGQIVDGAIDLAWPVMISIAFVNGNIVDCILWYFILLSTFILLSSIAVSIDVILGNILPALLQNYLQLLLRLAAAIPFIIFAIAATIMKTDTVLSAVVVVNIVLAAAIFWPCPSFLHLGKNE